MVPKMKNSNHNGRCSLPYSPSYFASMEKEPMGNWVRGALVGVSLKIELTLMELTPSTSPYQLIYQYTLCNNFLWLKV